MKEIGAFEAKTKLGQVLDWVEAGEEVIITRRGKAVARLIPPGATIDHERARAAAYPDPGAPPRHDARRT